MLYIKQERHAVAQHNMAGKGKEQIVSMAPTSPQPGFTLRADTGGGAPLTVLWTSPASVGV